MDLESDRTLYIGNLDKNVSEDILYELFLQAGPIERVSIVSSSESFSYGFVTYKHVVSIEYAIQLYKGTKLFYKELSIKRKGKSNNNGQQFSNYHKYGSIDCHEAYINKHNFEMMHIPQEQLYNGIQNCKLNFHCDLQSFSNNKINFSENYRASRNKSYDRNKPYDRNGRDHSRSKRRNTGKVKGIKLYQNKKSRY